MSRICKGVWVEKRKPPLKVSRRLLVLQRNGVHMACELLGGPLRPLLAGKQFRAVKAPRNVPGATQS